MSDNENLLSSSSSDGSDNEIELCESDWEDESLDGSTSSEKSNESENSYDECNELNQIEHEYVHGDTRRREKLSEKEKTYVCLSEDAINKLINRRGCTRSRMTESCPHEFKCSDSMTQQFGLVKTRKVIKQFRLKYWTNSQVIKTSSIKNRRLALLRDLNTMYLRDEIHPNGVIEYKFQVNESASRFTSRLLECQQECLTMQ